MTALIKSIVSVTVPDFAWHVLIGMIICGILGSEAGRHISKKLDEKRVTLLFQVAMALVMAISIYNFFKFGR